MFPSELGGRNATHDRAECHSLVGVQYGRKSVVAFKMSLEACFLGTLALAVLQYVRIRASSSSASSSSSSSGWTSQTLFHVLIALVNLVRAILWPLPAHWFDELPIAAVFVLEALPALLYFAAYSLLVAYFAAVYRRVRRLLSQSERRAILRLYLAFNGLAVLALGATAAYLHVHGAQSVRRMAHFVGRFTAALSLSLLVCAVGYGSLAYVSLRQFPVVSASCRRLQWRVSRVMTVCCVAFTLKVPAVILISGHLCRDHMVGYDTYQLLYSLYLLAVDIVPSLLVLLLIRRPPSAEDRAADRDLWKQRLSSADSRDGHGHGHGHDHGHGYGDDDGIEPAARCASAVPPGGVGVGGGGGAGVAEESLLNRGRPLDAKLSGTLRRAQQESEFEDLDPLYMSFTPPVSSVSSLLADAEHDPVGTHARHRDVNGRGSHSHDNPVALSDPLEEDEDMDEDEDGADFLPPVINSPALPSSLEDDDMRRKKKQTFIL